MTQALILANALAFCDSSVASQAAAELRAQHARIAELEQGKCLHQIAEPAAAQAVQAAVPGVCVLVPVDPTEEMEQAAADYLGECVKAWGLWKAMLAAAPAHPAEGVPAPVSLIADARRLAYVADQVRALEPEGSESDVYLAEAADVLRACADRIEFIAATHPTQQGLDRQKIDPLRQMIAQHQANLEQNQHAYFELAYTRSTGWMVWITDKPLCSPVVNPDRKVLWRGQGDTPDEACENAALAAQAKHGEQA